MVKNPPSLARLAAPKLIPFGSRISLKGLLADPLDELLATLTEGQRVSGRVVRLEPFGAFVELTPGVEGLIHISAMAERHITHPREILALGQEITSTVISLDRDRRRIGLSLVEEARAAQAAVAATLPVKSRVKVRIERVESKRRRRLESSGFRRDEAGGRRSRAWGSTPRVAPSTRRR